MPLGNARYPCRIQQRITKSVHRDNKNMWLTNWLINGYMRRSPYFGFHPFTQMKGNPDLDESLGQIKEPNNKIFSIASISQLVDFRTRQHSDDFPILAISWKTIKRNAKDRVCVSNAIELIPDNVYSVHTNNLLVN